MRNSSWNDLVALIDGKKLNYQPVGFIIDSPGMFWQVVPLSRLRML